LKPVVQCNVKGALFISQQQNSQHESDAVCIAYAQPDLQLERGAGDYDPGTGGTGATGT
jgi:hypothetical protein